MFKKWKSEIATLSQQEREHDIPRITGLLAFLETLLVASTAGLMLQDGISPLSVLFLTGTLVFGEWFASILWLYCSAYRCNKEKN